MEEKLAEVEFMRHVVEKEVAPALSTFFEKLAGCRADGQCMAEINRVLKIDLRDKLASMSARWPTYNPNTSYLSAAFLEVLDGAPMYALYAFAVGRRVYGFTVQTSVSPRGDVSTTVGAVSEFRIDPACTRNRRSEDLGRFYEVGVGQLAFRLRANAARYLEVLEA